MKRLFYLFVFGLLAITVQAQDTLPKFSVKNVGSNRIIIGWVNKFPAMRQISIQRSHDSLSNYKTILSVTDPNAVQNGFADTKAPNDHMYYRLFYVLGNGTYYFTNAKKPFIDTAKTITGTNSNTTTVLSKSATDTVIKTNGTVVIKKPEFVPSFYVYSNPDGNIFINLPDADKKEYRIKFFEENGAYLFEIKNIKESGLTLDKSNFYHAGWFKFELFDEDKIIERHKFYISKNF